MCILDMCATYNMRIQIRLQTKRLVTYYLLDEPNGIAVESANARERQIKKEEERKKE